MGKSLFGTQNDCKWALIEAPIPNAPEGKYISQIPSPNNLLSISTALKSVGESDIKLYQFLKERSPPIVKAENIVYNLGEATCMDYLYNYALKYLELLLNSNPGSKIYLTGYHAWLHKEEFKKFIVTTPRSFENDIIGKSEYTEWHNDWEQNDWGFMKNNVSSKSSGIRCTIRTSRGCPYHCKMCPVNIVYGHGKKPVRYSVDWVMKEIRTLYHNYGIREIGFLDDNLFYDRKWGKELLNRIINEKLKGLQFTFEEGLDVPTALDEELVQLLKKAHFYHIKLGVESFDKETLKFIQKPYRNPGDAIRAIKLLQKYHLNPTCFICIGFPTNTEESIRRDIQTLVDLKVKLRVQILWAYPGIDFVGRSLSHEELRALQKEAMVKTGSCSWVHKDAKTTI